MLGRVYFTGLLGNAGLRQSIATIPILATIMLIGALSTSRLGALDIAPVLQQQMPDLGKLPLYFEPNVGQADPTARFITRAGREHLLHPFRGRPIVRGGHDGSVCCCCSR